MTIKDNCKDEGENVILYIWIYVTISTNNEKWMNHDYGSGEKVTLNSLGES